MGGYVSGTLDVVNAHSTLQAVSAPGLYEMPFAQFWATEAYQNTAYMQTTAYPRIQIGNSGGTVAMGTPGPDASYMQRLPRLPVVQQIPWEIGPVSGELTYTQTLK